MTLAHKWLPRWLLAALLVLLAVTAIYPADWRDFIIEHVLTFIIVGLVAWATWRRPLSNVAYTLMFAYLVLHFVGVHYTYSFVPYDTWARGVFNHTVSDALGWERNHYDRLVHLAWGLLLYLPMSELVALGMGLTGWRAAITAIAFLATGSGLYELLEWLFTIVMSPEQAETYNGQQGDLFDPQKDMALAFGGSVAAAVGVAMARRRAAV